MLVGMGAACAGENLIEDTSFEIPKEADQFGLVFEKWGGWNYEGDCRFAVGCIAHSGQTSCLLIGRSSPKIRIRQEHELEPGRYRVTAFIRGLDISTGTWNSTTEFMFNDSYVQLQKNGTFGWTRLTYVGQVNEKKKVAVSFGLMAPGYFWIDDVVLEKVEASTPLTEKPELSAEEMPIVPPGEIGIGAVRCCECGYRNMPAWKRCYACGTPLEEKRIVVDGPLVKRITSFEDKNPFENGVVVREHATDGRNALRIDRSYAVMDGAQDWTGYDYLKADLYTDAKDPLELYLEVRDTATRDYWTRVNYTTVVPPGHSTLVLPVKQLYVGEKSRPGRMLILNGITRFVLSIGDKPAGPLYVDDIRLERDESAERVRFDGLYALDFGTGASPVMEGFTQVTPASLPVLDFSDADSQMQLARDLGFLAVCSYGSGVTGLNAYYQDTEQMKTAGLSDYDSFIKTIYTSIQNHADEHRWLPTYWNLADEPIGDDLKRSIENATAYHRAFPKGPPFFTGASSFSGSDTNDPHFQLAKALHVVNWNMHDEAGVKLIHEAGGDWAFYNGGNRWTYGDYLYKAAKQFGMKFRLSWHWNATAGDPYYALDCREDDYAWCNATPDGRLVPAVEFERLRAGLDDYRHLLTLARLANEKTGSATAEAAEKLIAGRLAASRLGQREHDRIFGFEDWQSFRRQVADMIERLR
jgi:hypothetical protein